MNFEVSAVKLLIQNSARLALLSARESIAQAELPDHEAFNHIECSLKDQVAEILHSLFSKEAVDLGLSMIECDDAFTDYIIAVVAQVAAVEHTIKQLTGE